MPFFPSKWMTRRAWLADWLRSLAGGGYKWSGGFSREDIKRKCLYIEYYIFVNHKEKYVLRLQAYIEIVLWNYNPRWIGFGMNELNSLILKYCLKYSLGVRQEGARSSVLCVCAGMWPGPRATCGRLIRNGTPPRTVIVKPTVSGYPTCRWPRSLKT